MTDELKYYKLKKKTVTSVFSSHIDVHWQFYSLYNGARGGWHTIEELAIAEGEAHKALIIALHGKD